MREPYASHSEMVSELITSDQCTVCMTASPTVLFDVAMQTEPPWISIATEFYHTVTAQCGENTERYYGERFM